MNKNSRLKTGKAAPPNQLRWLPLAAAGAVVLIMVGLAIWWTSANSNPVTAPQAGGAPRLAVDRTTIDDGYVKFETPIQAAFKLGNTGAQPLQIFGEPKVELIEGC